MLTAVIGAIIATSGDVKTTRFDEYKYELKKSSSSVEMISFSYVCILYDRALSKGDIECLGHVIEERERPGGGKYRYYIKVTTPEKSAFYYNGAIRVTYSKSMVIEKIEILYQSEW